jgi:uncharacterized membrane protein
MLENLFTSSPSVWSALLAGTIALPLLIHLINLLRHKRVKWAAMEFLLKSDKKHRNWVWLKQLLLLLSRIALLVLALLMLAQVGCHENRIARLLGGATTHHYVLLDDSFSMSARNSQDTAFDRARSTLSLIKSRAKNRQNQLITVFRASAFRNESDGGAAGGSNQQAESPDPVGLVADLNGVLVDNRIDERMESAKTRMTVSNLAIGLENALDSVAALIKERQNENAIVYVLSDFRQRDWQNPQAIESLLREIEESGAAIELIRCETRAGDNLAITALQPAGNVRVAGTPMMMMVTVKNYGSQTAEKIQVKLNSIAIPITANKSRETALKVEELPTVFIPEIPAGESAARQFPVFFATVGQHVVFADLPFDSVAIDNRRWCQVECKPAAKVLIIDNTRQHSGFLSLALNPNRLTGIQAETQSKDFLRDNSVSRLDDYDAIFLLDVDVLDETALKNLESYVARGGGLGIFLGPNTNRNFYNQSLYKEGEGLSPMPLGTVVEVPEQLDDTPPDIAPDFHPIFAPVLGVKNSVLSLVQIKQLIIPSAEWETAAQSKSKVLATVRGVAGWPLVVEKQFGDGRVVLFTTTAGPIWNNWSRNATFPPILLLLQDYLAKGRYRDEVHLVGTPIRIEVPEENYLPRAGLRQTLSNQLSGLADQAVSTEWPLRTSATDPNLLVGTIGRFVPSTMSGETDEPGIYDLTLNSAESEQEIRRLAFNVDSSESELVLVKPQQLLAKLSQIQPSLVDWNQFNPEPKQKPDSSLGRLLLILLIGLLVTEQVLAYSSSYHQ